MIIDMHLHIGNFSFTPQEGRVPLTWENQLARLDAEGIDLAVMLPVYNASPEGAPPGVALLEERMSVRDQVIDANRYPDRIIPFGNLDPRWGSNSSSYDFSPVLDWFIARHCKGVGEVTAHLPFDDPRVINMFRQLGAYKLLVTIESAGIDAGAYGLQDEPGAPRLERLLREAPLTTVIGHGPGFWAEIGSEVRPEDKWGYPKGKIGADGALARLLANYANLYADISAYSGYNALTRDPDYTPAFLERFQNKLLFGTDTCFADPAGKMPQLEFLKQLRARGQISAQVYDKITGLNAARLLGLRNY
ncbi:MAG: amidohydrolase family protein [Anaerolineae bacterium]